MAAPQRRGWSFRVKLSAIAILVAVVPLIAVGVVVDDRYEEGLGDANRDWIQEVANNLLGVAVTTFDRVDSVLAGVRDTLTDPDRDEAERIATAGALVATLPLLVEVGIYDERGARIDVIRGGGAGASNLPTILDVSRPRRFRARSRRWCCGCSRRRPRIDRPPRACAIDSQRSRPVTRTSMRGGAIRSPPAAAVHA